MATPEGRVKAKVNRRLAAYPAIWRYMPVQSGYGKRALDYLLCVPTGEREWIGLGSNILSGQFVVIETKRKGKALTPTQETTKTAMERAGGKVFVVDDDASLDVAMNYIHAIYEP